MNKYDILSLIEKNHLGKLSFCSPEENVKLASLKKSNEALPENVAEHTLGGTFVKLDTEISSEEKLKAVTLLKILSSVNFIKYCAITGLALITVGIIAYIAFFQNILL